MVGLGIYAVRLAVHIVRLAAGQLFWFLVTYFEVLTSCLTA